MDYTIIITVLILIFILPFLIDKYNNPRLDKGAPTDLYDPEKEVLIAFCKMQNCGHCVRFNDNVWTNVKPELEGKKNANGKTIKMITVDPNHELSKDVSGFPTIKKFGDDATKYVEFTESRTVENFKSFCMN
jgi:hypothetical protein